MPGKERIHSPDRRSGNYSDETFESDSGSINSPIVRRRNNKTQRHPMNSNRGRISPNQSKSGVKRMLSARNRKIHDLSSKLECLEKELAESKMENKTLRRQAYRQEKALEKSLQIDHSQSELPSLIERHAEEVRCMKEQIKRYKEKMLTEEGTKKDLESEVNRLRKKCTKFKQLADDKELLERDVLRREVDQLKDSETNKNKRVEELERKIELLEKNHKVELKQANNRNKVLNDTVKRLEARIEELETQIKEKEKMLEIQNIYSQRVMRPPHRLDSGSGSTPSLNQIQFTSQWHNQHARDSKSEVDLITPREKMKLFDERRRADQRRRYEEKEKKRREKALANDTGDSYSDHMPSEDSNRETLVAIDEKDEQRQMPSDITFDLSPQNKGEQHHNNKSDVEPKKLPVQEKETKEKLKDVDEVPTTALKDETNHEESIIEEEKHGACITEETVDHVVDDDDDIDSKAIEELKLHQDIENSRKEAEKRKKEELLAELKKLDDPHHESERHVHNSNFSDKVENMHRGKPASSDNPLPEYLKKRNSQEKKEESLMEDLFGSKSNDANSSRTAVVQPQRIDEVGEMEGLHNNNQNEKKLYKRPNQRKLILSKPAPEAPGVVEDNDDIEQLIL